MKAARGRVLGLIVVGIVTVATGALSRVPYSAKAGDAARLRMSWRMRSVQVERCRELSPDEIARLPTHMRRTEECSGGLAPYRLEVRLDGRIVADEEIHGEGARQDRPIYVFRDIALPPGLHRLSVRFTRIGDAATDASAGAPPARLELDTEVTLDAGEIGLVTYDAERRTLVVRQGRGGGRPTSGE